MPKQVKEITSFEGTRSFGDKFREGKEVLHSAKGLKSKFKEPTRVHS